MALIPASEAANAEDRLLFFGTAEVETIVACAALARAVDRPLSRVFAPVWDLSQLPTLPSFCKGATPAVVVGFPAPELAWKPAEALAALQGAKALTWVSHHPVDGGAMGGAEGALFLRCGRDPWPELVAALDLPEGAFTDLYAGVLAELPEALPDAGSAGPRLAWRYALEAARQEPERLGIVCRALSDEADPDPELVGSGRALIADRREIARTSRLHTFAVSGGQGVIVPVPRSSMGFYRDLAADAREHRGCAVHLLCFDSQEPAVVEYAEAPVDLPARMTLARSALPDHQVLPWGEAGFAVVGPATGGLPVLEALIDVLGEDIQ